MGRGKKEEKIKKFKILIQDLLQIQFCEFGCQSGSFSLAIHVNMLNAFSRGILGIKQKNND